ncbi:uncharacterized protein LOC128670394 isoform X2 [Plodia interpunctella]|uniref:uncharacterized protein LOC128670394 isoform X2 n=1 Tax=Plodia interpunctella TaxID=58824 RepID=UPI002368E4A6|nr:uncharacterized protein LOC128670394 isoform X2 [Plodia interpunctella]
MAGIRWPYLVTSYDDGQSYETDAVVAQWLRRSACDRKYWCDWKHKLKKRSQLVGKNKLRLTKLDKKALAILGGCDQKANDSALDEDFDCNDSPPIIKLEACDDVDSNHLSGDEQTSDVDSECNNNDAVNDSDQNSSDPLLSNIYPKWLIEVEKKRAEAELLRAKAEEQRASVAAKTAEAALIQAEALKKLAEATSNQADALMRIATVLEARGESDVLSIGRF